MKIGQVDTEIALLIVKKEEINASKIHSPVGGLKCCKVKEEAWMMLRAVIYIHGSRPWPRS